MVKKIGNIIKKKEHPFYRMCPPDEIDIEASHELLQAINTLYNSITAQTYEETQDRPSEIPEETTVTSSGTVGGTS